MDPIYRVVRRDPNTGAVERVDKPRLLSPAEREEARRRREEKRREQSARELPRNSPQEPGAGTDYYG